MDDRAGEAATCYSIGLVYRSLGDLGQAVAYLERCVVLDEQIQHPDLHSDRQMLAQLQRERDVAASPRHADQS